MTRAIQALHERSIREVWAGWTGLGVLIITYAIAAYDLSPALALMSETAVLLIFRTAWLLAGRPGESEPVDG